MTEKQNIENMRKCVRFESCNINICPLDFWYKEKTELPEEERCLFWKVLGENKTKRMFAGHISATMRGIVKFIRASWKI